MITEWQDSFNSFNSWKGLMYAEHYRAILTGKFLPPIECSVDPVNACNLNCLWCNGHDVKSRNVYMDGKHLLDLINFFKVWGAKAVCFAGGGEPTLHPNLADAFELVHLLKFPAAIITNGTFLDERQIIITAQLTRWIGVSVDCATREVYLKLKGADIFDKVINNIIKLVSYGAREVTYKFLLHPLNQHEVYKAIELAKDIGCHQIHIRPVSFMNFQNQEDNFNVESIDDQVLRGRGMFESAGFKVFYIRHKFDKDMHRKFGFKKCLATPIMPIFHANNDISICIDRKADKNLVIGSHEKISEIPKIWGSQRHKDVINSVKLEQCPKCTIQHANTQMEQAIIENKFAWEFV